ncbi:MAG: hypothetical protein ACRDZO_24265 [Egibacteraceae bacterium]
MQWSSLPCHGARHLYPQHQAVAGAWLPAVCNDCDTHLTVQLQADPTAESGLCAHWPDNQDQARMTGHQPEAGLTASWTQGQWP